MQVLSLPAIVAPIKVVVLPISGQTEFEPYINKLGRCLFSTVCILATWACLFLECVTIA